jgi:predicted TIM-barrel fold metal-dependent hydrolase
MKIDCHSHFFDPFIREEIRKTLKEHNICEKQTAAVRSNSVFLNPEERLRVMDASGIDIAAIEYHVVYQHYEELEAPLSLRIKLAELVNNRLAGVSDKYPDRYWWMADIPLIDTDGSVVASILELKRAYNIGAKGVCLRTNINSQPLTNPDYKAFWVEVNRLGLPVLLHPRSSLKAPRVPEIDYMGIGFEVDTALAGIDLLIDDFFSKYKRINVMLCHSGGALASMKIRLDDHLTAGGVKTSTLLDKYFYDVAISFPRKVEFLMDIVGLDQLCYGSDYPYRSFGEGLCVIDALGLDNAKKEKILSGNARRFFGAD